MKAVEEIESNETIRRYRMNFTLLKPIVTQLNDLGVPVTITDLIELTEGRLSGRVVGGIDEPFLEYTFETKK